MSENNGNLSHVPFASLPLGDINMWSEPCQSGISGQQETKEDVSHNFLFFEVKLSFIFMVFLEIGSKMIFILSS